MDGEHSYRDFIDPSRPMYLSDRAILTALSTDGVHSPHSLAASRYRENVIRLQLRDLARIGMATEVAHESFKVTEVGKTMLQGDENTLEESGMVSPELFTHPPEDDWRLCDFSALDSQVVKETNQDIRESGSAYGWVQGDRELTKQRIDNVKKKDIRRIIREFPTNEPLPSACAHWVRALVGLHLFPDANHRTATNTLEYVLIESGLPGERVVQPDIARYVLHSKYIRTFQADVRFNTLWEEDELYQLWYRYFSKSFMERIERRRPNDPTISALDTILERARIHLQRGKIGENDEEN